MAQDAYSQLVPMLSSPDDNGAALLGLSGAVSLEAAELVIGDSGLLDILFEIAAEEEGVSAGDVQTMARMMLASTVQSTFPESAPQLLPPIEALISQGVDSASRHADAVVELARVYDASRHGDPAARDHSHPHAIAMVHIETIAMERTVMNLLRPAT